MSRPNGTLMGLDAIGNLRLGKWEIKKLRQALMTSSLWTHGGGLQCCNVHLMLFAFNPLGEEPSTELNRIIFQSRPRRHIKILLFSIHAPSTGSRAAAGSCAARISVFSLFPPLHCLALNFFIFLLRAVRCSKERGESESGVRETQVGAKRVKIYFSNIHPALVSLLMLGSSTHMTGGKGS